MGNIPGEKGIFPAAIQTIIFSGRLVNLGCDSQIAATPRVGVLPAPVEVNQSRYEALRACYIDGATLAERPAHASPHPLRDGGPSPPAPHRTAPGTR